MKVTNFARFYALLDKLPGADKETLVYQFTGGRTSHLHLMKEDEYRSMCNEMERVVGYDERRQAWRMEMKRRRSAVLHQMQLLGVDTANWGRVDAFCLDRRMAGKPFRELDGEELDALLVKLRIIWRKRENPKNDKR